MCLRRETDSSLVFEDLWSWTTPVAHLFISPVTRVPGHLDGSLTSRVESCMRGVSVTDRLLSETDETLQ